MKRLLLGIWVLFCPLVLAGCSTESKATDLTWLYGITAVISAVCASSVSTACAVLNLACEVENIVY